MLSQDPEVASMLANLPFNHVRQQPSARPVWRLKAASQCQAAPFMPEMVLCNMFSQAKPTCCIVSGLQCGDWRDGKLGDGW